MRCARSVLLILVLLAGSLSPPGLWGQEARAAPPAERGRGFYLEQNSPNPVNPDTWIPFYLEDGLFEGRDSVVVTLRVFNILRQVIAIPDAVDLATKSRSRLINLVIRTPGRKLAYWDGKDSAGRRVPSGVYYSQLVVDSQGEPQTRKMIVLNPRRRRNIIPWFGSSRDRSP